MDHSLYFRIDDSYFSEDVKRLHIGDVYLTLALRGITTLGDLLQRIEVEPHGLRGIEGLGREGVKCIGHRLEALSSAVDEAGHLDWKKFDHAFSQAMSGMKQIAPSGRESSLDIARSSLASPVAVIFVPVRGVETGMEFIEAFPEVINAVIRSRNSEVDRLILTERLARDPHERKTLEGIASAAGGQLTRERVRQREQKLINQLASALIHGGKKRLDVNFHPSFKRFWKSAADWFGQKEEIGFWDFIGGLSTAWEVPVERVIQHLPLMLAVLTQKATIPEAIREQMKLAPRVLTCLGEASRDTPLSMLSLGKVGVRLGERGMETVGDLLTGIKCQLVPSSRTRAGQVIRRSLGAMDQALSDTGTVDWARYGAAMGFPSLPATSRSTPIEFLGNLSADVERIVRVNEISMRALEIFRLRIAVSRRVRPTLAQVAGELKTHGPTIKREESILLKALNDLFVERDFTHSLGMYSSDFLRYWSEAADSFRDSAGSFEIFSGALAASWDIPMHELTEPAEILWAVLNEYPGGRTRKSGSIARAIASDKSVRAPMGVIALRGFRRVH